MTRSERLHNEDGWVLVTAVMVLAMMLAVGLALLSVVDTQTNASAKQRKGDSAFNYAEGALNSTAFVLSRAWPDDASVTPVAGSTAACNGQALTGSIGAADPSNLAGQIQNQLTQTFGSSGSGDYPAATTSWRVNVCDDVGQTTRWTDSILTSGTTAAWDSNGEQTITPTTGSPYKVRRVWVRAQATVAGRTRAVVGLVQVNVKRALPSRYAALAGGFSSDLMTGGNSLLTGPALAPVTTGLLNQRKLYAGDPLVPGGGKLGIRCGLTSGCVTGGAFATLSSTQLGSLLLANDFVHFGSPQAASDATLDQFRREAKLKTPSTYFPMVGANQPCMAADAPGRIVFIEQVGDGDDACTISTSRTAKMLVVASGRVRISGTSASPTTFTGVIYAAFGQRDRTSSAPSAAKVVAISDYAKMVGAVYVDGDGRLDVRPPAFNVTALLDTLPLCQGLGAVACNLLRPLPTDQVLSGLLGLAGGPTQVPNALLAQLSGYGPAVQENKAAVDAITTYGSSGTAAGTFRQIQPT